MKNLIFIFLFFGIATLYIGCSDNNPSAPVLNQDDQVTNTLDKKPAPTLNCTTEYFFVGLLGITDAQGRLLAWEGPISGDINGVIQWWMDGATMVYTGQASHYEDRFVILNDAGEFLLAGDEAGSTTARHGKNSNWRTNGIVTDAAPDYEDWIGRMNHCEGHFTWADLENGIPDHGYGTFRVN
jgi:hypothetical protein